MKKTVIALAVLLMLAGCDSIGLLDEPYNHAVIYSPDGEIAKEGDVKRFIVGSSTIIVEFSDGITYATSAVNVILINDKDDEYYINQEGKHDL